MFAAASSFKSHLIRTIKIDDYLHGVDIQILREPILASSLLDFGINIKVSQMLDEASLNSPTYAYPGPS